MLDMTRMARSGETQNLDEGEFTTRHITSLNRMGPEVSAI
jgi:hypothetical protein